MPGDSRLRLTKRDDVTIVEFIDRNILDEGNIQAIGEELGAIIDAAPQPRLLISFANVDHLSSAALGTLITVNNKIKARGGRLVLANIDEQIFDVFRITRLDRLFQIRESTDLALKALA